MVHKYGVRFHDDFDKMINDNDDPVVFKELLIKFIPDEAKAKIVLNFNAYAVEYNLRQIELKGIDNVSFSQQVSIQFSR